MVFRIIKRGKLFVWHGGPYIDIMYQSLDGHYLFEDKWWSYSDLNINVWDYDKDQPRIPRTLEALEQKVTEWLVHENN